MDPLSCRRVRPIQRIQPIQRIRGNITYSPLGNFISGIGFSTNSYNYAMSSGVVYYWNLSGGTTVGWSSSSYPHGDLSSTNGGDGLAYVTQKSTLAHESLQI